MSRPISSAVNVFDLDGTLYEMKGGSFQDSPLSSDVMRKANEFVAANTGEDVSQKEFWAQAESYGEDISRAAEDILGIPRKEYFEEVWGPLVPSAYITETFDYPNILDDDGNEINVIVTSAPQVWATSVIDCLGIKDFVSTFRTGEPEPRKPDPQCFVEPIDRAISRENVDRAYFIGDQLDDFPSSKPANVIEFFKIYIGDSRPGSVDYRIDDISELKEVKKEIEAGR